MELVALTVALMSGATGAHLAAKRRGRHMEGLGGIMLSGAMGGLIGSQVFEQAMVGSIRAGGDLGSIVVQSLGGAAGGAALLLMVHMLRTWLQR